MSFEKHLFNIKNKICSCVYLYIYTTKTNIYLYLWYHTHLMIIKKNKILL